MPSTAHAPTVCLMLALSLAALACRGPSEPVPRSSAVTVLDGPPAGAVGVREIEVTGMRWRWGFDYDGATASELVLGVGETVHLRLVSIDVAHVFEIPEFGVHVEVAPDEPADLWLAVHEPAETQTTCVIECDQTGAMVSRVRTVPSTELEQILAPYSDLADGESLAAFGVRVYARLACGTCHGDTQAIGPSLRGVWGSTRTLADGRSLLADEAYLRRAILEPTADLSAGYSPVQPQYDELSEAQIRALIELMICWGDEAALRARPEIDCNGV